MGKVQVDRRQFDHKNRTTCLHWTNCWLSLRKSSSVPEFIHVIKTCLWKHSRSIYINRIFFKGTVQTEDLSLPLDLPMWYIHALLKVDVTLFICYINLVIRRLVEAGTILWEQKFPREALLSFYFTTDCSLSITWIRQFGVVGWMTWTSFFAIKSI